MVSRLLKAIRPLPILQPALTVIGTNARLIKIQITPAESVIPKGVSLQLNAIGTYSDGTTANISSRVVWKSSSANVSISNVGIVSGKSQADNVQIHGSLDGVTSNTALISISRATLKAIQVTPPLVSLAKGNALQLRAIGLYSDDSFADLTDSVNWASSVPEAISLDGDGIANALKTTQNAIVYASLDNVTSNTVSMTVTASTLSSIQISPNQFSLVEGHQNQMTALGIYSDKTSIDVTERVSWSSSDTANLTVNHYGVARAVAVGRSIIVTASLEGISSNSAVVDVSPATLETLQVTPASVSLPKGTQQTLTAIGTFSDGTQTNVTSLVAWKSVDPDYVTVDAGGIVTAINTSSGTSLVATLDGIDSNLVNIIVTSAQLESIQLSPAKLQLAKGTTSYLTATGIYSDKSSSNITSNVAWHSGDTNLVTVARDGQVTAVNQTSNTALYAVLGNISSNNTNVVVTEAVLTSLQATPTQFSAAKGITQQLTAIGIFSDNTKLNMTDSVTWLSEDTEIVTVSNRGIAKGIKTSNGVTITAHQNGIASNNVEMSVQAAALTSIQITPAQVNLPKGLTQQLSATGSFTDGTSEDITSAVNWQSSDTESVTVNGSGLVQGVDVVNNISVSANLNNINSNTALVSVAPATIESIQITPALVSLPKGVTRQMKAMVHSAMVRRSI
ncbi:hypothetical protein AT251_09625 [Enterovibrio nigricans]|nr:hypothetical protein AT251_09625 [Enterovibrio nigricans]